MRISLIKWVAPLVAVAGLIICGPAAASSFHKHNTAKMPAWLVKEVKLHPGGIVIREGMVLGRVLKYTHHRGKARTANGVTGNCGYSWLYIANAGWGWTRETYGLSLNYPLMGGSATISWSNQNTGGHNAYLWSFGPDINGNASDIRDAYTRPGWIYAVMYASAVVITWWGPTTCHTPYGQPYSVTYTY